MAQECGFFNAQLVGEEYDRVYLAEQFAAYFASFIGNGVFGKSMQKLEIVSNDVPNMTVKVLPGEAWINGWWYRNTDEYILNVPIADGVLSRIDAIVLRWGNIERDMWLDIIPGEPSANPKIPALRRNADYYDLRLGYITVNAGSIKVVQSQITDTRLDSTVCGLVTGVVDQIDTKGLYDQFIAYFNDFKQTYTIEWQEWFKQFKDFIESLENGELLLRVEELLNQILNTIATNSDIDAIINGTYVNQPENEVNVDIATEEEIDAIIGGIYIEKPETPGTGGGGSDQITSDQIVEIVDKAFEN